MNLFLIRHGQTAYNRDGLALGIADVPLTPLGEAQAAAVGAAFAEEPIDTILTSPLSRAAHVARAIAGERATPIETRPELLELDVGITEGRPFSELRETHGQFLRAWAGPAGHLAAMPGGESVMDVDRRLAPFVEELRQRHQDAIALVSHNFVLRVLFCRLVGLDAASFRSVVFDVGSISRLELRGNRALVWQVNDTCHLHSLNLDRAGRNLSSGHS